MTPWISTFLFLLLATEVSILFQLLSAITEEEKRTRQNTDTEEEKRKRQNTDTSFKNCLFFSIKKNKYIPPIKKQ